jgi:hypothetical protein
MRKLPITVFAAHWLFFSGLIQAQGPSGNIDLKAKRSCRRTHGKQNKDLPWTNESGLRVATCSGVYLLVASCALDRSSSKTGFSLKCSGNRFS